MPSSLADACSPCATEAPGRPSPAGGSSVDRRDLQPGVPPARSECHLADGVVGARRGREIHSIAPVALQADGGRAVRWVVMRRSRAAAPSGTPVIDGFSDLVAIGSGGFSMVYRAHELALDRAVAVKVLNTGLTSERERRDFERECKALGQLNHPDVVTVYRPAFTDDGRPCIVMALYERNFRDQLDASGPLPPAELLDVGIRMAVALHVAHRRGVLHRDVKPHNIFRSVYGDPALGDFGISTLAGERSHDRSTALSLAYVAPEILDDAPPSAQADVYSLAATLHHLATGKAPFDGKEPSRVVNQVLHDEPPPLDRSDLPLSFQRVLRMAMEKDPAKRPADARAFAEMLREVQARAGLSPT